MKRNIVRALAVLLILATAAWAQSDWGGFARRDAYVPSVFKLYFGDATSSDIALQKTAANVLSLSSGSYLGPGSTVFANIGAPANGVIIYCSDCTIANPCAGGGTGALAKRLNAVWVCN